MKPSSVRKLLVHGVLGLSLLASGCAVIRPGNRNLDPSLYPEPQRNAVTFWGHACAYLDFDGYGIVTDPVFEPGYAILHPRVIAAPVAEAYDQTRVVLISHAHHDHVNRKTLSRFSPQTIVLCSAKTARYLRGSHPNLRVMRPGEMFPIPNGRIIAVAAYHPGGRFGLKPREDGAALGYVIQTSPITVYYSGDTESFEGFERVGRQYRPDLALLNVNAHLHSAEALMAVRDLGVSRVIPLHFGAYWSPKEKRTAVWRKELESWLGTVVQPLAVGECRSFSDLMTVRRSIAIPSLESTASRRLLRGFEVAGIPRFARVDAGLARGGRPGGRGIQYLADQGYRTVVSFVHDTDEGDRVRAAGIDYVEIPLRAGAFGAEVPNQRQVEQFLETVLDSTRRPVFIHCRHGKDRTGAMAAVYRIEACGWTPNEAVEEMERFGFSGFYRGLRRFVREYRPREAPAETRTRLNEPAETRTRLH